MKRLLYLVFTLTGCAVQPPIQPATAQGQPRFSAADVERAVHAETNRVRRRARLEPLAWNTRLAPVARSYSRDMSRRGFFAHVDPDGRDPTARAAAGGFTCRRQTGARSFREGVGENLARVGLFWSVTTTAAGTRRVVDWRSLGDLARTVVGGWMDSPAHRRNLLDAGYGSEAIGVAIDGDAVLVTQALC